MYVCVASWPGFPMVSGPWVLLGVVILQLKVSWGLSHHQVQLLACSETLWGALEVTALSWRTSGEEGCSEESWEPLRWLRVEGWPCLGDLAGLSVMSGRKR